MRSRSTFMIFAVAGLSLGLIGPASAARQPNSFFEIEHVVGGDGVQDAEQALVERIAGPGIAIERAKAALQAAGAWYVRTTRSGQIEYDWAEPETFVTVDLRTDGLVVTSVKVRRQTLGG